jgi:hypothetical protein
LAEIKIGRVRLALRGEWSALVADYGPLDTVSHLGSTWIAKQEVPVGTVPNLNNIDYWVLGAKRGEDGIDGINGTNGVKGDQGIQGETGATGPTGPQGIQGETGNAPDHEWGDGTTASIYSLRFQQTDGTWGEWSDVRGQQGATGPQGVQGQQGDKGTTGATGPVGPQGPQGPQGIAGTTTWAGLTDKPQTAVRWPTFEEVTGKPAAATRWPTASEIEGFPNVTEYSFLNSATVGGSNNAITLTSPNGRAAVTSLSDYDKVLITVKATSTSTLTIKVDSLAPVAVANVSASVRLYASAVAEFLYIGGKFYLVSQYNPKTGNNVSDIGEVFLSTTSVLKSGEVYLNGGTLNRADHPIAFAIASSSSNYIAQATKDADLVTYGAYWGSGNDTTTFTLPLISDKFIKAAGGARGHASFEATDNLSHSHSISTDGNHSHSTGASGNHRHASGLGRETNGDTGRAGASSKGWQTLVYTDYQGNHTHPISTAGSHTHTINTSGGSESRPNNYALNAKTRL